MPNTDVTTFQSRDAIIQKDEYFSLAGHPLDGKLLKSTKTANEVRSANAVRKQRTSTTTPNYRSLIKRRVGLLPENSFSVVIDKDSKPYVVGSVIRKEPVSYGLNVYTNTGMSQYVDAPGKSWFDIGASTAANARDRTVNKVLLKIKDQKFNAAQALAERAQTSRLVLDTARRLANAIESLRSGNIVGAAKAIGVTPTRRMKQRGVSPREAGSDFVSKSWLELQYGWKPLLNDVFGSMETLASLPFRQHLNHVTSSQTVQDHDRTTISVGKEYVEYVDQTVEIRYKYGIWFSVGDTALQSASSLGLTNPALLAWELLPFSFVADWFVPIGNYISTWDATLGCDFQQGYATTVTKRRQVVRRVYSGNPEYTPYSGTVERVFENLTITRDKLLSFPSARPPSFKNPVSTDHVLNALALLTQLTRK